MSPRRRIPRPDLDGPEWRWDVAKVFTRDRVEAMLARRNTWVLIKKNHPNHSTAYQFRDKHPDFEVRVVKAKELDYTWDIYARWVGYPTG